jgi:hypothetical protein
MLRALLLSCCQFRTAVMAPQTIFQVMRLADVIPSAFDRSQYVDKKGHQKTPLHEGLPADRTGLEC